MNFRVSAWAIRNPLPVTLLFIALTLVGLMAYASLPIKQYPNISFPLISVGVTQRGAAPSEMESQITRPVENAIAGVAGVKHINSQVTLGASSTAIEFELDTDMQKAIDDVRTAVERVRINLPTGIDPPSVTRVDIDSAPILTYAVSSSKLSAADLSWFVEDTVARAVQAQPGVAQVIRVGGVDREINVVLQPDRMAALGVTAPQINAALSQFNTDETGGRAGIGAREQSVRVLGSAATVDAIRAVTIPVNGRYVRLADVAEVGDGSGEVRSFALLDGRPAVAFQINKTKDASDVAVEKVALAAIDKLAKAHPEVKFTEVISTVEETRATFENTVHVLLEGMVLAALVVLLFLRNWRATAIAATAMPLSLIPTFAFVALFGFSLNMITLLALTLVIGILVDDAIVEIENIQKRVDAGARPYQAAIEGADAIGL
ncbi:MAG: efflux RND transporter permease subunit, partial [Caulobacteraceae bacterium]